MLPLALCAPFPSPRPLIDPSGEYGTFAAQSEWVAKYLLQPSSSSVAESPVQAGAGLHLRWLEPPYHPPRHTSQPDPKAAPLDVLTTPWP